MDESFIEAALERSAVEMFVKVVDPLDQVMRERQGLQPDTKDRDYLTGLLTRRYQSPHDEAPRPDEDDALEEERGERIVTP